jgi:small subunit ribosomal protein S20
MPHHKSAEKRMRTSEKARQRNRTVKSKLKSALKNLDMAPADDSAEALRKAQAELDRAAKKRVIPKGRADRKKSRLARQVNRAKAATS